MENNNLTFSFEDLVKQTDNLRINLINSIFDKGIIIISVKVSFQDEHIIYKCPNTEIYKLLISRLEYDYNNDNYIIAIYKHFCKEGEVIINTDIIIPRNTTLLEDDFIGSLDDLPF